jgi:hypothetical protein
MRIQNIFKSLNSTSSGRRSRPRLSVESLEDRCLPSFLPTVSYPVGLTPQAVVTGDFNGDGRLDLVVANAGDNTVGVFLGNGDGTFQAAQTSSTGTGLGPQLLVAGDLNRDGRTDLVTVNNYNDGNGSFGDLSVLLGNGDGTFQPPRSIVLPGQFPPGYTGAGLVAQIPQSIAIGDLNGDGKLDLVGTGETVYSVIIGYDYDLGVPIYEIHVDFYFNVLLGNGDGTFVPGAASHLNGSPSSVELGDFNNDGRLDVAYDGGGGLNVRLGNGDGTLQAAIQTVGAGSGPVGDCNGDGKLDILGSQVVWLGNGDGTFRPGQLLLSLAILDGGDVNGDGKLDVVLDDSNYNTASVLLGNGDGSFSLPITSNLGNNYFTSFALANFEGNGHPDLVATAMDPDYANPGFVVVAHNDGNWTPPPPPPPSMTIGDVSVIEGNTGRRAATFTVTLSKSWDQPVTVAYATADYTATAGSDYQATSGTLMIPAGQTSGTIPVLVNGDRLAEQNEYFVVNLSSPTNAAIADGQGQGTILDDEPRIFIGDVAKYEGKKGQTTLITFAVTLSAAYDQPVTLSFKTTDSTAKTSDNDYVARTGTLTFAPGETTKTITIVVNGDNKREADESFCLDLFGNSSNSLFTKNRGIGTILNDD